MLTIVTIFYTWEQNKLDRELRPSGPRLRVESSPDAANNDEAVCQTVNVMASPAPRSNAMARTEGVRIKALPPD